MKEKITYLQNEHDTEEKIVDLMEKLNLEEASLLLKDITAEDAYLNPKSIQSIKEKTFQKLGMEHSTPVQQNAGISTKRTGWKGLVISAAVVLLCLLAWRNGNSIALAFNNILSLIPGVGIIENNPEILYRLNTPVGVEGEQGTLNILSVVATKDAMTVNFSFERKNYTEEQLMADKQEEWDKLVKGGEQEKPNIYILTDNQKFQMTCGSNSAGLTENYNYTFELEDGYVDPSRTYKLVYEDYHIDADFQIVSLEQYQSLDEIGATDIHNNISLTATASLQDGQLMVNVYPVNYTEYNLISFDQDYSFEYFGKKLKLKTEKGEKDFTLPDSYGSGMNAGLTFDVSDGAKDYLLSIPYIVVESKEEEKITLPIPEEGETIELNKEVEFENGSVIIKSVEKLIQEGGNEFGDLKVNLEYKNVDESQQLVGIELTRKTSEGWSVEYDAQNRVKTICYMLEKSDKNKLKLYVVKPRYVFMDEYSLKLK